MHKPSELLPAGEKGCSVRAFRLAQIEVHIAVSDMPESDWPYAWAGLRHCFARLLDKAGHRRNGHRNIMLDRATFEALGFHDTFPQTPEISPLSLGFGDGGVGDETLFVSSHQRFLQSFPQAAPFPASKEFDQHVPAMGFGHGVLAARDVPKGKIQRDAGQQFEGGDTLPRAGAAAAKQLDGRFWIAQGHKGGDDFARTRIEVQDRESTRLNSSHVAI